MDKHVSTLIVRVVRDQQTSSAAIVRRISFQVSVNLVLRLVSKIQAVFFGKLAQNLADTGFFATMNHLNKLRGLASRSCTHIKHDHSRAEIHEAGWNHAHNFLSANVAHSRLGNKEFLESREWRELANNVLGRGHPPSQLVGVPSNRLGRFDGSAILVFNICNLGDISCLKEPLDSQGMPEFKSARERESVGQRCGRIELTLENQ